MLPPCFRRRSLRGAPCLSYERRRCNGAHPSRPVQAESSGTSTTERPRRLAPYAGSLRVDDLCLFPFIASDNIEVYFSAFLPNVNPVFREGYLKSDVGFFCFRVFEKGGCSKVLCGVFSFRAVRGKAVAVKFYVGFPIRSDLCRKRHRHLTEDADAFLLECSGNQLNNSSSFCWSVPSLAYGSASNCRKLCLMSFVSSLKPRMYESAM